MGNILIKSPINYTGNKYRILNQLLPYIPETIDTMVDMFCGGATVGANVTCKKVVFIDNNAIVIGLLEFLAKYKNIDNLIKTLIKLTDEFNLTCSGLNGYSVYKEKLVEKYTNNGLKEINSKGFYELRDSYNSISDKFTEKAFTMLYLLIVYGFNNDIRFSKEGKYNLPIGKTDLNKNNLRKIKEFSERMSALDFQFVCTDFNSKTAKNYVGISDFVYIDPPYLITRAVYNESTKWDNNSEYRLLDFLDELLENHKSFMLSNVLEKKGIINEPLSYWIDKHMSEIQVVNIDYHYRSSSYNKIQRDGNEREIIIIPRRI
jgi:DNA adenine methylase Dam